MKKKKGPTPRKHVKLPHRRAQQAAGQSMIGSHDAILQALSSGDWARGEALCRERLALGEDMLLLAHLGFALRRQNRNDEAKEAYGRAVQLPGTPAELWFNYGNLLADLGTWDEAEVAFAAALQLQGNMPPALLQWARCAMRKADLPLALERFKQFLSVDPNNFSGWLEAGNVSRQLGDKDWMLVCYRKATEVAPNRWEGFISLARSLEENGEMDEAATVYHRALAACPTKRDERNVHWVQGKNRLERGDTLKALESFRAALACTDFEEPRPDENTVAELQIDIGQSLWRLGMREYEYAFTQASLASSEAVLTRLAETLFRNNLWEQAVTVLRRATELHPQSSTAHWNLAHGLNNAWVLDESLEALDRAEAIAPMPGSTALRAGITLRLGDVETALKVYLEMAKAEGPYSSSWCSAAMASLYSADISPEEVAQIHRELFASFATEARERQSFTNHRDPMKTIKVGLVTADLHHQHPVNIFMQPVLRRLNRTRFEVTVYFVGSSHDEQTALAQTRVANWLECASWDEARLAKQIEEDGIDIIIDLAGHTAHQRGRLFAKRVAPVQVTFLGYPGSTGLPNMDWLISDAVVSPETHAHLYSEKVYRLPHIVFCYAPEEHYPFPVFTPQHAERTLTFGSFNNVPKLTAKTVRLWADILLAVPDSRLVLKAPSFGAEGACKRFAGLFAAHGVDPDRLEFRGPVGLTDMMAEYADIDIALDPVPYNGGTTTLQGMWMGVPAVVLEGGNFSSRMGASFMQAAGMPEWVARDPAEYVAIAQRMASDRAALLAIKRNLRQHLLSRPGWDIDGYTRDFEIALQSMWADWCQE
jgi:protein O-GlcNAc transferase